MTGRKSDLLSPRKIRNSEFSLQLSCQFSLETSPEIDRSALLSTQNENRMMDDVADNLGIVLLYVHNRVGCSSYNAIIVGEMETEIEIVQN